MSVRTASAIWNGDLKSGNGTLSTETKVLNNASYSFISRFDKNENTNPEELIGAAHAGCFSMALANALATAGHKVNSIKTTDRVHLEKVDAGMSISKIVMETEGSVEGIDDATFQEFAENAKKSCIVARALAGVTFEMTAKLV